MRPPVAPKPLALALLLVLVAGSVAVSPGSSEAAPEGHWEVLGEDGTVWVPAERPGAAYLPPASLGAYHNHTEMETVLMSLASARPDMFSLQDVGTSVDGRTIWMLRATGPGDAVDRPRVLFDGAHHGDEVIGSESLIRFLLRIHETYETNATVRAILDAAVLDVVPMVNPDSIQRIPQCDHYATCRKNSRGVDLNRNYADHWGGTGSSSSPSSATYRGPSPLSEPETQAIATLLDTRDYALHASFHSGAELILWPHGWTTAPPLEESLYETLGDELTAITGIPNGQTSEILYTASGTTMDQAYGMAAGWRPISFSPESYEGSGNAFDWWLLFNPPEDEASVASYAEKWIDFSFHLAAQAPQFHPARIDAPDALSIGPDAGTLDVTVTSAPRRPFIDAMLRLDTAAPLIVDPPNPTFLDGTPGPQTRSFQLIAERGGDYAADLLLDAGPAGTRTHGLSLHLTQLGLDLSLDRTVMGTPHHNAAHTTVTTGPFDAVSGTVSLSLEPAGIALGDASFSALPHAPAAVDIPFTGIGLPAGTHRVVATTLFTATLDGTDRTGTASAEATLVVQRPDVQSDKRFAASSPAGQPLEILSIYRNVGNLRADDLFVSETVPLGYTYWFRDGPVPLPSDPLGPLPITVNVTSEGIELTWALGDLAPGGARSVRYRLMPLLPGEATLTSTWGYMGDFGDASYGYDGATHPTHTTT